jgi:hypothetical protein
MHNEYAALFILLACDLFKEVKQHSIFKNSSLVNMKVITPLVHYKYSQQPRKDKKCPKLLFSFSIKFP